MTSGRPGLEFLSHFCKGVGELAEIAEKPISSSFKGLAELLNLIPGPRGDPLRLAFQHACGKFERQYEHLLAQASSRSRDIRAVFAVLEDENITSQWLLSAEEIVKCRLDSVNIAQAVVSKAAKRDDKFRDGEGARILHLLVQEAFKAVLAEPAFSYLLWPAVCKAMFENQDRSLEILSPIDRRRLAVRWIIELAAAVFVDEMRMLYVGASDVARSANAERYPEFVGIAEQHLEDLKSQLDRFTRDLESNFIELVRVIERRQIWVFHSLKTHPCKVGDEARYFPVMRDIAEGISALCCGTPIVAEFYNQITEAIARIGDQVLAATPKAPGLMSLDTKWRIRLRVQSVFLSSPQESGRPQIRTIADDMDVSFALAYFIVDRWLMLLFG